MEVLGELLLGNLPAILISIAKIAFQKLAEVGGITPKEQALIELIDCLEKLLNAS